jgi:magnesium transporter
MTAVSSFYLSRMVGNKIFLSNGEVLGKLQDFIVNVEGARPKVTIVKVKSGRVSKYIDISSIKMYKEKGQYVMRCQEPREVTEIDKNSTFLVHHILDKQIVDMNGRKLVRANDIRLANVSSGLYVIAVDVGGEGLLRRLGVAKPVKKAYKLFGKHLSTRFILWDSVQTIASQSDDIKLSTSYSKLFTLHPSDLADIIEDLDKKTQSAIFASLDEEKAADVLEEMETETQLNILHNLSIEKAADVLELMPADEVADILDEMKEEKAEELLLEMDKEASDDVKELMEYEDDTVGSIMSIDFISFKMQLTAGETIEELRRAKPETDIIYYLYVTDYMDKLAGVVSLRDLVIAEPDTKLSSIMSKNVIFVQDEDNLDSLVEIISKYSLLAVPVVEKGKDNKLAGVVVINDIVYELLKSKRRKM